jgi:two-component system phosphate regulon sensor histidine kinase PhoR
VRGLRLELTLGFAALAVLAVLVSGLLVTRGVRARELSLLEGSLAQRAALVRDGLGPELLEASRSGDLDAFVRGAARAAEARVGVIDAAGRVLADSSVPAEELARQTGEPPPPEVRDALAGRRGIARREGREPGERLLWVALPAAGGSAVRLAADLAGVEARVAAVRRSFLQIGALGLAAALGLAWLLSTRVLRPVRELRDVVGSMAGGNLDQRLAWSSRDELGQIAEAINEMGDQLRRRLREVTAEKEQLQTVLAAMVEGVLVVDREGRVLLANPRLRELFDVWGDVTGRPHWELLRQPEVEAGLRRAAGGDEATVCELATGEPEERILQMHAVRFPASGPHRGTVAVFHDVTDLRRLERLRSDFVANVSHELKTPLTAIRGFAETLLGGELSAEQRVSYLRVILRHADRLGRLIEDILDLSRIEGRKLPVEPAAVDVARVAGTVLRDMTPQLASRSLAWECTVEGDTQAWADRRAVEQVLTNLLDNAAKYTEPGGRIAVRVVGREREVCVEVSDTGIGIPEADLPRVFERFYRVDKARSRDLGGTGLGLAIVKHLVQLLGGEVFVESEVGKGSRFSFTLPRSPRA